MCVCMYGKIPSLNLFEITKQRGHLIFYYYYLSFINATLNVWHIRYPLPKAKMKNFVSKFVWESIQNDDNNNDNNNRYMVSFHAMPWNVCACVCVCVWLNWSIYFRPFNYHFYLHFKIIITFFNLILSLFFHCLHLVDFEF